MTRSAILKQNQGFLSTLPVGVIIAWHRDIDLTRAYIPQLSPGWVECNGQVLHDPESPFDNQRIPDLNGEGRFLRGATTSGRPQPDAFQGHHHGGLRWASTQQVGAGATGDHQVSLGDVHSGLNKTTGPEPDGISGPPSVANETRPINMSVVWIMKVKQVVAAKAIPAVQAATNAPLGAIYIDQTGNVGIATATPRAKLDVGGDILGRAQVFQARMSANYAIGYGWDVVPFNIAMVNTLSGTFDGAAHSFKASRAGYYQISVSGYSHTDSVGSDRYAIGIGKNGAIYNFCGGNYCMSDTPLSGCTGIVYLNGSTDFVQIRAFSAIPATWMGQGQQPGHEMFWFMNYLGE